MSNFSVLPPDIPNTLPPPPEKGDGDCECGSEVLPPERSCSECGRMNPFKIALSKPITPVKINGFIPQNGQSGDNKRQTKEEKNANDFFLQACQARHPIEALGLYNRALQINPQLVEAHRQKANIFLQFNQINEALKEYRSAIHKDPFNPDYYIQRGSYLLLQGNKNFAERHYSAVLKIDPENALASYNLAMIRLKEKQYEKGIEFLSHSIKHDTDTEFYPLAYFTRGLVLLEINQAGKALEDFDEIINAYNKVLEENKDLIKNLQTLNGVIDSSHPLYKEYELFHQKVKAFPFPEIYYHRALALETVVKEEKNTAKSQKKIKAAIEDLNKFLYKFPEAQCKIGELYYKAGELESAKKHLQQSLRIDTNNPYAYYHLGKVFYKEAEDILKTGETKNKTGVASFNAVNLFKSAVTAFTAAIKAKSTEPAFYEQRGKALKLIGRTEEAKEDVAIAKALKQKEEDLQQKRRGRRI